MSKDANAIVFIIPSSSVPWKRICEYINDDTTMVVFCLEYTTQWFNNAIDYGQLMKNYRKASEVLDLVNINYLQIPNTSIENIECFLATYNISRSNIQIIKEDTKQISESLSDSHMNIYNTDFMCILPGCNIYDDGVLPDDYAQYDRLSNFDVVPLNNDIINRANSVVCGGTFDRMHTGHYLFLLAAYTVYLNSKKPKLKFDGDIFQSGMVVGVTAHNKMIQNKQRSGDIEIVEKRINRLKLLYRIINPNCDEHVYFAPLMDSAGPAMSPYLKSSDLMICTDDSISGAIKVNLSRQDKGYEILSVIVLNGLDCGGIRISSSKKREIDDCL